MKFDHNSLRFVTEELTFMATKSEAFVITGGNTVCLFFLILLYIGCRRQRNLLAER
jgi:hypothetical protein